MQRFPDLSALALLPSPSHISNSLITISTDLMSHQYLPCNMLRLNTIYSTSKVSSPGARFLLMRWSLPLPRVRPQISKSSLTFTHHPLTHSPHPLKSYIHLLLPKHNAIILALIIRFHHHTNLLNNLSASTYLKTAFILISKVWFALLRCKFILYTWNEYIICQLC